MSGIAGWIDCQHDLSQQGPLISKMVGQLSHRGPGAQSQWLSLHAALAHCCSNAIGLRADEQPMVHRDEERTYVITCDGVIYNARELRCELERSGHTFRTPSDTEVLLHASVAWGTECVRHLHGI